MWLKELVVTKLTYAREKNTNALEFERGFYVI